MLEIQWGSSSEQDSTHWDKSNRDKTRRVKEEGAEEEGEVEEKGKKEKEEQEMEEKNKRKEVEEKALLKWWVYIKRSSKDFMCFILFNPPKSCEVGITPFLQTAIQWQDCNSKSGLCPSTTHTLSTPLWYLDNQSCHFYYF